MFHSLTVITSVWLYINILSLFEQLEDVMDKETYKKAKEILQRFDPEKLSVIEVSVIN